MEILILGIVFGIVTVASPGPISVSLVQVASAQGRSSGMRAAAGIASGDALLAIVAVGIVSLGANLPARFFAAAQVASAALLILFGALLVLRPVVVQEQASSVSRPLRTFFFLTSLMPTALGSWLAVLSAMPFAADLAALAVFAIGIVLASALWHPILGIGAGAVGPRLTPRVLRTGTQLGGLATAGIGAWLLF